MADLIPDPTPATSSAVTIADLHAAAQQRDPWGDYIHRGVAVGYLVMLPFSTALSGITFGLLALVWLARLRLTWRGDLRLLRVPLIWGLFAWAGWTALSMAWSVDVPQGVDEFGAMRVLLTPLLLWPVISSMTLFIIATLVGVHMQNFVQLGQWFDVIERDVPDRLNGLLHAGHTGSWCAAAMVWHVAGSLRWRGWKRVLSLLGLVAASVGLIAAGSRGPWISAAISLPPAVLVIAARYPATRRFAGVLILLGLIGGSGMWIVAGSSITNRIENAIEEIELAVDEQVYWTSSGLRVAQSDWAIELFRTSPIIGIGGGSYPDKVRDLPEYHVALQHAEEHLLDDVAGYDEAAEAGRVDELLADHPDLAAQHEERMDYLHRGHAHSVYLQILACQGIIGLLIFLAVVALLAHRGWASRTPRPYADVTTMVLLGWLVGSLFDAYHMNGHQLGIFAVLTAISLYPLARGERSSNGAQQP